jgi:hypothetical protein
MACGLYTIMIIMIKSSISQRSSLLSVCVCASGLRTNIDAIFRLPVTIRIVLGRLAIGRNSFRPTSHVNVLQPLSEQPQFRVQLIYRTTSIYVPHSYARLLNTSMIPEPDGFVFKVYRIFLPLIIIMVL